MGDAAQASAPEVFLGEDRRQRRAEAMIFGTGEIAVPAPVP
jgi:hypothetical protein